MFQRCLFTSSGSLELEKCQKTWSRLIFFFVCILTGREHAASLIKTLTLFQPRFLRLANPIARKCCSSQASLARRTKSQRHCFPVSLSAPNGLFHQASLAKKTKNPRSLFQVSVSAGLSRCTKKVVPAKLHWQKKRRIHRVSAHAAVELGACILEAKVVVPTSG